MCTVSGRGTVGRHRAIPGKGGGARRGVAVRAVALLSVVFLLFLVRILSDASVDVSGGGVRSER